MNDASAVQVLAESLNESGPWKEVGPRAQGCSGIDRSSGLMFHGPALTSAVANEQKGLAWEAAKRGRAEP